MKLNRDLHTTLLSFKLYHLAFLTLVFTSFFFIFYHEGVSDVKAQSLPNCDELSTSVTPNWGVNCVVRNCDQISSSAAPDPGVNCRYRDLPLCSSGQDVPSTPVHRENCYDIVDLPLCSHIASAAARQPLKNCVRLCSDSHFTGGGPSPVFNQNCVRFCDDMPSGMAENPGVNCVRRTCHQLPFSTQPNSTGGSPNCSMVRCDRLWPVEHERLYDATTYTWRYCSHTGLKCYDMEQDLLQYYRAENPNPICNIHSCPPGPGTDSCNMVDRSGNSCTTPSSTCARPNDYDVVLSKSTSYRAEYDRFIADIQDASGGAYVQGIDIDYPGACSPLSVCPNPPDVRFDYRVCGPESEAVIANRTIRDGYCDSTGLGSDCQGTGTGQQRGMCYKTVNCTTNPTASICPGSNPPPPPPTVTPGVVIDNYNSWFYRPTPSSKATRDVGNARHLRGHHGAGGGFVKPGLCYAGRGDWRRLRDVTRRRYWEVDLGFLGTVRNYMYDLFEDSISPGVCGMGSAGHRGNGYIYLKGTRSLLYDDLDNDTMYYEGEPATDFSGDRATYTVKLCLRFKNTVCLQCEGRRECVPTAGNALISSFWSQACGHDLCRTFAIQTDSVTPGAVDPQECMMRNGNGGMSGDCSSVIDTYIRMRAVYYDSQDGAGGVRGVICGYTDAKGHLAYQPEIYGAHRGNEHIGDNKTCENDPDNEYPNCSGFDSASDPGLAHKWRTVLRAQYIGNNQPAGSSRRGYYDKDGNFFYETHCAPVRMRTGTGLIYNVANITNSPTMFNPPLLITRVNRIYGSSATSFSSTDFHRPEVMVQYGSSAVTNFSDGNPAPSSSCYGLSAPTTNCLRPSDFTGHNQVYLSLDANELSGRGASDSAPGGAGADSPAYARIYTEIPGVGYRISTEVFLEKTFNYGTGLGQVCVYEKVSDANGNYSPNPLKVACFNRSRPGSGITFHSNGVDSTIFGLRLRVGATSSSSVPSLPAVDIPSSTTYANFNLLSHSTEYCSTDIENYRFCLKRGQCTQLARECSDAASARSSAIIAGTDYSAHDAVVNRCNNEILPFCLAKRGLPSTGSIFDIMDSNDNGAYRCKNSDSIYLQDPSMTLSNSTLPDCQPGETPFLYGWFNVVEITKGIDNRLPYVVAHRIPDGRMGMCQVRADSPNLVDGTTSAPDLTTDCLEGGNGSTCRCVTVPRTHTVSDPNKFYVRRATPKEIGANHDIPMRRVCPAYVGRFQSPNVGENFSMTNLGETAVGSCDSASGWAYSLSPRFQDLHPRMDCVQDTSPTANPNRGVWDLSSVQNPCVRKSCNLISAGDPNPIGEYLGIFDDGESGECRGAKHGFANWPSYTPSSSLTPARFIATATSCIAGFKPVGSTATVSGGSITGYTGGSTPDRLCGINGVYSSLTRESVDLSDTSCSTRGVLSASEVTAGQPEAGSSTPTSRTKGCERITCPAINPSIPTSSTDTASWNEWFSSGGATYPETNASRSTTSIHEDYTAVGTCNRTLGFTPPAGGDPPSRTCDHLGNWGPVVNPCSTLSCSAIGPAEGANPNHGFALWDAVSDADMAAAFAGGANAVVSTAAACTSGYVQNPYPPATDMLGTPIPSASSSAYLSSVPAELPKRYCIGANIGGSIYKMWRSSTNSCINACPGSAEDSRIGVGSTRHRVYDASSGSRSIVVEWPSTPLGQYAYVSNWPDAAPDSGLNTSHFVGENRTNGFYLLRRRCRSDGSWDDIRAMCAMNDGVFGSARFRKTPDPLGYENSLKSFTDYQYSRKASLPAYETATGVCDLTSVASSVRSSVISTLSGLTLATPVIYCRMPPGNLIDRTHVVRTTSTPAVTRPTTTDCGVCSPVTGDVVDSATGKTLTVVSQSRNYYPSEILTGSAINCGSHHTYQGPTSSSLTATCDVAGTGDWTYQNANYCRASCLITPSILASMSIGTSDHCSDGGVSYAMRASELTTAGSLYIKDGEIFEFIANRSCRRAADIPGTPFTGSAARDYCSYWRRSMKCVNGAMVINSDTSSSYGGCNYSRFNYAASNWGAEHLYGISSHRCFVAYRHIQRTPTLATGLGMLKDDDQITDFNVVATSGCPGGVATWGISSTTPLAGGPTSGSGSTIPSNLSSVSVATSIYSAASMSSTQTSPCVNSFTYTGTHPVTFPSLAGRPAYNPGYVKVGSCASGAILGGGLRPRITCSHGGDWVVSNDGNCVNPTSSVSSISGGTSVNVYNPGNPGSSNPNFANGNIYMNPHDSQMENSDPNAVDASGVRIPVNMHNRSFDLTSSSAIVMVDLNTIDQDFGVILNGRHLFNPKRVTLFPNDVYNPAIQSIITFVPGDSSSSVRISTPWAPTSGSVNLPRIRMFITSGSVQLWGTRSSGSTTMELMYLQDSGAVAPQILNIGTNNISVINYDGRYNDGMSGRITVRQF